MSSITRYITWELIAWLAVVLVGLTCVLVLMVVVLEASRMNLGLGPTLKLLPFTMPMAIAYAAPCAMLFTVCFIYGRMSADNEVIAAKALGVSPVVLLWPAWIIAFGLSLVGGVDFRVFDERPGMAVANKAPVDLHVAGKTDAQHAAILVRAPVFTRNDLPFDQGLQSLGCCPAAIPCADEPAPGA